MTTNMQGATERGWMEDVRTVLAQELEEQLARLNELTGDVPDPGEAATRAALIGSVEQRVTDVRDALRRIEDGSYGQCERCGNTIPRERLEIMPHARLCVPCQQARATV